ncbi:hypothetical protein MNBD_ALPHA03-1270 [hydrothermal vent metagenome]|uniref:Head fiber protein n=1 Tax=hydrothermal vent metagenome TaxID=652676 RepID=A0A3B1BNS4_9ZZZZ
MTIKQVSNGNHNGTVVGKDATDPVGFHGATPVVQGAAITNPVDAATTQAAVISILGVLRANGLIAT